MINGRRALVKKVRKVKATPAPQKFIAESAQREASLRARQEGLRTLEQQRRKLIQLQRDQTSQSRQPESRWETQSTDTESGHVEILFQILQQFPPEITGILQVTTSPSSRKGSLRQWD